MEDIILKEQISIVYQPIVDLDSGHTFGYEALVRGPKDTPYHYPTTLLGVAKEKGLLLTLDMLIIEKALIEGFPLLLGGAKLFLNVSMELLSAPWFPRVVLNILSSLGEHISPSRLVFELPEITTWSMDKIKSVCNNVRKYNFQIAIDDFGQGTANINSLMEIYPDFVKLDRLLCKDIQLSPEKQELVKAISRFSILVGGWVIGEGIESTEELQTLKALNIKLGQGFLLGRPSTLIKIK